MNPLSPTTADEEDEFQSSVEPSNTTEPEPGQPRDPRVHQLPGSLAIGMIAGFMFGTGIGFIPAYFVFDTIGDTCTDFTGQGACEGAKFADCVWTAQLGAAATNTSSSNSAALLPSCKYADYMTVDCGSLTQSECTGKCRYHSSDNKCVHVSGLSPHGAGLFSSSYFVGGTIAPLFLNHVLAHLRFRPTICLLALLMSIGAALAGVARATNTFPLLLVGFLFCGFGAIAMRYVVNFFVFAANADKIIAGKATASFQPMTEVAALCGALFVFYQGPTADELENGFDAERRIQSYLAVWHVGAAAAIVVSLFLLRDTPPPLHDGGDDANDGGALVPTTTEGEPPGDEAQRTASPSTMTGAIRMPPDGFFVAALRSLKTLLVGFTACAALALTGLPAISAYVPLYSQDIIGLETSVAPLVTMGSAAAAGLLAFGIRRVVPAARPLMLIGVAALFLVQACFGTILLPGVVKSDYTRNIMAIACIALFFLVLEVGVGATFFELSLSAQPPEGRSGAGALLNSALGLFSVIVSSAFPVAVAAISGSDGVRLGWAVCLFFFAFIAAVCFAVQYPFLRPWAEEETKDIDASTNSDEDVSMVEHPGVLTITVAPVEARQKQQLEC